MGRPGGRRLGRLHRAARARSTPAGRATSTSSCATTTATRTCSSRPPTRPGRRTTTTAATASTSARPAGRAYKVSYNRPFDDAERTRTTRSSSTASTRWSGGSSGTATTSATPRASTPTRRGAELLEHQDVPFGRPRRVLVRRPARERRGGARRRRQPRVLQRQRGLLEDPLGDRASTARARPTDARLATRRPQANAKIDPSRRVDRDLARSALQPTGRRRTAGERAHRHGLHGQLPTARTRSRSRRRYGAAAVLAQHERRGACAPGRRRRCRAGRSGYEWDEDRGQRLPAGRPDPALLDDAEPSSRLPPGLRQRRTRRAPATHSLTLYRASERRARLRRRHGAVGLGPRRRHTTCSTNPPRPTDRSDAAGHGQPVRRHGRRSPATLQSGARRGDRIAPTPPRRPRRSPRPPPARPSPAASQ